MNVHIYRPPLLSYAFRKLKFYDEKGKFLSYTINDSEITIKNSPNTIKAKIDWLSGKISNLEGEEVYLACYPNPKIFWRVFSPIYSKKYFIFKNLSKEDYKLTLSTKGEALNIVPKVSKMKSIVSRLISLMMLIIVITLFYLTDYSTSSYNSDDIEFIRVLGLIMGFGGVAGLVFNIERYLNLYLRATLIILITIFFGWVLVPQDLQITLFIYPIIGILFLLGIHKLSERNFKFNQRINNF